MSRKPAPKELRDDVVRVVRASEPAAGREQMAKDVGIHFAT